MSRSNTQTVTVTLSPAECRLAYREAERQGLACDVSPELLEQLNEAEALSLWLRDHVRLQVSSSDAAIVRDLLRSAQPRSLSAGDKVFMPVLVGAK